MFKEGESSSQKGEDGIRNFSLKRQGTVGINLRVPVIGSRRNLGRKGRALPRISELEQKYCLIHGTINC